MTALLVLGTGLLIVIVGILVLRLHAFVALALAALAVSLLTPETLVLRSAILESSIELNAQDVQADSIRVRKSLVSKASDKNVRWLLLAAPASDEVTGPFRLIPQVATDESQNTGHVYTPVTGHNDDRFLVSAPNGPRLLIRESDFVSAKKLAGTSFISRVTDALGSYCGKLAILIVSASIIGRCLLDSGAADCIVKRTLQALGERAAPAAFAFSGFTLGIPVFFDTVFYLMIPLGKALRLRTGGNYLLYVLSIVIGGTMAHSLVPPTPGPLFIAEEFGVSLGSMILGGIIVGLFSASVGMIFAVWINRRCELPLRDFDESTAVGENGNEQSPGLLISLTPIVLPVILITMGSLLTTGDDGRFFAGIKVSAGIADGISNLSEKNLALLISAMFAVLMYIRTRKPTKDELAGSLQSAVASAGTIILVTAAGGAFGRMMRQTSVAELLQDLPQSSPVIVIVAAFLVTTAVRTAQGSATVAMMTAAGIFGGLVTSGAAGVHPLYVALAVGCGSKPIAWMNDSGFWVITRMSGMTEAEGLRYVTPMTALAGIAGLGAVIVGVLFFPMM